MNTIPIRYKLRSLLGRPLRRSLSAGRERFLSVAGNGAAKAQRDVLRDLLRLNAGSQFAKDFGLSPEMSPEEFRHNVPVCDYETYRPYVDRMARGEHQALLGPENRLLMFAITSGTTSQSKLIPVTSRFLSDYRTGWQTWGVGLYSMFPTLPNLNVVQIASSHRKYLTEGGTPCGNISGLVASMQNPVVRSLYTIPSGVAEIASPELKRRMTLALAMSDPTVGMFVTANPSTLLQLLEHIRGSTESVLRDIQDGLQRFVTLPGSQGTQLRKRLKPNPARSRELQRILQQRGSLRVRDIWPFLNVLAVWTGGSAGAYIGHLQQLCEGITICDHGLHASEGRMTMPITPNTSAGILEVQTHYFEFIPLREADSANPIVLDASQLQEGEEYYILLTTSSGFCRYNIRDVVRCVGHYGQAPMLEFRHKGAHISSITGEKLSESQVVEAVQAAQVNCGVSTTLYTLTPEWDDSPGYTLYVDLRREAESRQLETFAAEVEAQLCFRNEEYREKRGTGRLRPVQTRRLPESAWTALLQTRLQRSGGSLEQYKHPCLMPDPDFRKVFLEACGLSPKNPDQRVDASHN